MTPEEREKRLQFDANNTMMLDAALSRTNTYVALCRWFNVQNKEEFFLPIWVEIDLQFSQLYLYLLNTKHWYLIGSLLTV